jgi:hypothetical protein
LSFSLPLTKHVEATGGTPVPHPIDLALSLTLSKTTNIKHSTWVPFTIRIANIGDVASYRADVWVWIAPYTNPYGNPGDEWGRTCAPELNPHTSVTFTRYQDTGGIIQFLAPSTPGTYRLSGWVDWDGVNAEFGEVNLNNNKCSYVFTVIY